MLKEVLVVEGKMDTVAIGKALEAAPPPASEAVWLAVDGEPVSGTLL